ncbi:hypothetical protein PhCBS80983_g03311 [Powellomyces hirtus]|uniref:GP-PDE domain-containing protein n=1 Tax=Powellomyces hirtus TaxID=109895 RepID=A0A507E322_9FUNG|nr:hypothetical protein PhCBS80983_g03311 [Powellomyces hirtus]
MTTSIQKSRGLRFKYRLMSHRGGSLEHVENTLPGFRYSAKVLRVDLLELDVYETKDGEVVIFHDMDMGRLCGLPGKKIKDFDYDDLPKLLIPAHLQDDMEVANDPASTKISLLTELFDEFPQYPMQIDVKRGSKELITRVGTLIRLYGRQKQTVWGSFHDPHNEWCRTLFTDIPHFFTIKRLFASLLMYAVGMLRVMEFHEHALIMPNWKWIMWPGFARALNRRGVPVIVFGMPGGGVNTQEGWEAARVFGANGICTDRPTALKEWLETHPLKKVSEADVEDEKSKEI